MQTLIPALLGILRGLPLLPRATDCYVTPHPNWMPTGAVVPALGLHPSKVVRSELTCGLVELAATISMAGYVGMDTDGEMPIYGQDGVYALLDAATELLMVSWQDIPGCQGIEVGGDNAMDLYESDGGILLVKLMRSVTYTVQR